MTNNKILNIADGSNSGDAVNYKQFVSGVVNLNNAMASLNIEVLNKADEKDIMLLDGSNKMTGDLDMANKKIINLSTDSNNITSATSVQYVNRVKSDMMITLTNSFIKKIHESDISSSTSKRNVFKYIMDDVI